ncbi:MAG: pyruvate kinase [Chloroflexota bacterium]|jgi:pyruvate kinase|nr:pyruvate kinase [Chloroflexota bacterium]
MQTRIICTLGPASEAAAVLRAMVEAGMSIARLNFSHGTADDHRQRAAAVREVAGLSGEHVEIMQDLQGPKIRTFETPRTVLRRGDDVLLASTPTDSAIVIAEPAVLASLDEGRHVYIDDGLIELQAVERTKEGVRCRVLIGGTIEGNQGVVVPSAKLDLPVISAKDLADLEVGREIGVEWVAASFVQRASDVEEVRKHAAPGTRIIAKIETAAALDDLTAIIAASDAVMIARGDLGVSIRRAEVPVVQKQIIASCHAAGKRSIVATEMMLSMVRNPHPTRAEVGDVATAVFDGCNAVMLSEESAIGAYPVDTVAQMREIVETAEGSQYYYWHVPITW